MEFNKQNLRAIRSEMESALAEIAKKHDITFSIGSISFQVNQFTTRITCGSGSTEDINKAEWNKYCVLFKMKPEQFGTTFQYGGKTFRVVKLDVKKMKYPLIASCNGKQYKLPATVLAPITTPISAIA